MFRDERNDPEKDLQNSQEYARLDTSALPGQQKLNNIPVLRERSLRTPDWNQRISVQSVLPDFTASKSSC